MLVRLRQKVELLPQRYHHLMLNRSQLVQINLTLQSVGLNLLRHSPTELTRVRKKIRNLLFPWVWMTANCTTKKDPVPSNQPLIIIQKISQPSTMRNKVSSQFPRECLQRAQSMVAWTSPTHKWIEVWCMALVDHHSWTKALEAASSPCTPPQVTTTSHLLVIVIT